MIVRGRVLAWSFALAILAACKSSGGDAPTRTDDDDRPRRLAAQQDAVLIDPDKHWFALPPDAASGLSAMPDCERYLAAMEAYIQCDKFPASSRSTMQDSVNAMRDQWKQTADTFAQRSANEACKSGVDAVRQAATGMGCTIPP